MMIHLLFSQRRFSISENRLLHMADPEQPRQKVVDDIYSNLSNSDLPEEQRDEIKNKITELYAETKFARQEQLTNFLNLLRGTLLNVDPKNVVPIDVTANELQMIVVKMGWTDEVFSAKLADARKAPRVAIDEIGKAKWDAYLNRAKYIAADRRRPEIWEIATKVYSIAQRYGFSPVIQGVTVEQFMGEIESANRPLRSKAIPLQRRPAEPNLTGGTVLGEYPYDVPSDYRGQEFPTSHVPSGYEQRSAQMRGGMRGQNRRQYVSTPQGEMYPVGSDIDPQHPNSVVRNYGDGPVDRAGRQNKLNRARGKFQKSVAPDGTYDQTTVGGKNMAAYEQQSTDYANQPDADPDVIDNKRQHLESAKRQYLINERYNTEIMAINEELNGKQVFATANTNVVSTDPFSSIVINIPDTKRLNPVTDLAEGESLRKFGVSRIVIQPNNPRSSVDIDQLRQAGVALEAEYAFDGKVRAVKLTFTEPGEFTVSQGNANTGARGMVGQIDKAAAGTYESPLAKEKARLDLWLNEAKNEATQKWAILSKDKGTFDRATKTNVKSKYYYQPANADQGELMFVVNGNTMSVYDPAVGKVQLVTDQFMTSIEPDLGVKKTWDRLNKPR